ncbi:MAG: hypothetical protein JEZ11_03985 [Desulfobacterales bacterium]|nr:hypothetical protein [Desulfobacterales bacterium]
MKYTYIDFDNPKKTRFTRGQFIGWSCGLGIKRAIFALKNTDLCIPEYLLTPETKKAIGDARN